MKNIINKFNIALYVVLMGLISLTACKKTITPINLDPGKDKAIIQEINESGQKGIPFPEGSRIVQSNKKNTYEIILPKGYYYVYQIRDGLNQKGLPYENSSSINCTCDCTQGTGCTPVLNDGKYYCLMGENCSICNKNLSVKNTNKGNEEYTEIELIGLINRNAGITFLSDKPVDVNDTGIFPLHKTLKGWDAIHGNAFDALFEDAEIKAFFTDLGGWFQENNLTANKLVYVNLLGNVAVMPFYMENDDGFIAEDGEVSYFIKAIPGGTSGSNVYCSCNSSGNCTLKSNYVPIIGRVYYCELDGCTSCTIGTSTK